MKEKNIPAELVKIAYKAGLLIMDIYQEKFDVNTKRDLANMNRFLESSDINIRSNYKNILKSYLKFKKMNLKY